MSDDLHPVVKLMLARMESHPEEFAPGDSEFRLVNDELDRWWRPLSMIKEHGTDEEKAAINAGLRTTRLQKAHEWAMDELCNGPERRRKEEEEREYERSLLKNIQNQAYASSLQNQMAGSFGKPHPVGPGTYMELPDTLPTTNTGFVATMKKALGI